MSFSEYKKLWESLSVNQKKRVRIKCQWEHMGTWAVCNEWPGIWKSTPKEKSK